jgi:hypothetical protein
MSPHQRIPALPGRSNVQPNQAYRVRYFKTWARMVLTPFVVDSHTTIGI